MAGLKVIQIYLDSPKSTYYSGETVSGLVELHLSEPKTTAGILLKFKGEAEVRWTEDDSDNNITVYTKETYFTLEQNLGGSGHEGRLSQGKHTFPFHIVLPPGLPSSFEGDFGWVRYTIKATMEEYWKSDHEAKAIFTVVQHLDLNVQCQSKEPIQKSAEKFTGCLCCISGPIQLFSALPVTGYVQGQDIPLVTMVENATNKYIDVITSLVQAVTYRTNTNSRTREIKVCTVNTGSVNSYGSVSWNYTLQIPSVLPSFLRNCSIIDIDYKISVKATISGLHRSLKVELPIIIGTIPFASYVPSTSDVAIEPPTQTRRPRQYPCNTLPDSIKYSQEEERLGIA